MARGRIPIRLPAKKTATLPGNSLTGLVETFGESLATDEGDGKLENIILLDDPSTLDIAPDAGGYQ